MLSFFRDGTTLACNAMLGIRMQMLECCYVRVKLPRAPGETVSITVLRVYRTHVRLDRWPLGSELADTRPGQVACGECDRPGPLLHTRVGEFYQRRHVVRTRRGAVIAFIALV